MDILVVDDNDINLLLVEKILELDGHKVTAARSAREAIALCDHRFDMAVLDVMMPDMNGFELCQAIRGSSPNADIPILLLTAMSGENERKLAKQAGANDILSKPLDMDTFKACVGQYLPRQGD